MIATKPICRHCRKLVVSRPRGLCWTCYYTPGLREQYPSTSKFARRGLGNYFACNAPLPEPTTAPPGTAEKMLVLERRALDGQRMWHPLDAQFEGDPRPVEELLRRRAAEGGFCVPA